MTGDSAQGRKMILSGVIATAVMLSSCSNPDSDSADDTGGPECPATLELVSEHTWMNVQRSPDVYQTGSAAFFDDNEGNRRLADGQLSHLPEGWQAVGATDHGVVVLNGRAGELGVVGGDGAFVWRGYTQEHLDDADMVLAGRDEIIVEDYDKEHYVVVGAEDGEMSATVDDSSGLTYDEYGSYDFTSASAPSNYGRVGDRWFDIPAQAFLSEGVIGIEAADGRAVTYDREAEKFYLEVGDEKSELALPADYYPIGMCAGGKIVAVDGETGTVQVVDSDGEGKSIGSLAAIAGADGGGILMDGQYLTATLETYGSGAETSDYEYTVGVYGPSPAGRE